MLLLSFIAALLPVVVVAAPNGPKVTASVDSKQVCITKYKATTTHSPLRTRTRTSAQTISSTVTTCGVASTITSTITPDAVTLTTFVNATSSLPTKEAFVTIPAKVADACSITTTISTGTTTVYTGSYNGTAAKRTPIPLEGRSPFIANPIHIFGQRALGTRQKPIAVDCLDQVTTYYVTTSTIIEEPATEVITATTPTIYVTRVNKAVIGATGPVSITRTITAPPTSSVTNGVCTVTSAESTTTQHVKCAPTNLISSINGYGIGQTGGDSANTRGLAPGSDPSACCQLCVDDEDCAASEDDPDAGNCFLWYTTPSCGLGFRYSDGGQKLKPGSGFLVQTGCGTIEGVDSF